MSTVGDSLAISNLSKVYGDATALNNVSLSVGAGEFVTLLGPSGSGKTTLLMCIAGLVIPDGGSIAAGAREIGLMPPHQRDLGVVFQNYALFPHLSVFENVRYPLRVRRDRTVDEKKAVGSALDMVQLSGFGDRRVDQLSGGQRQRVALARALVYQPGIVLLDEPLSALDKNLRDEMQGELRRLHRLLGTTMVMVTHDQSEALSLSDRIVVMNHGKIVQDGTPADIYRRPATRFVAAFMGQTDFVALDERDGQLGLSGQPVIKSPDPMVRRWFLVLRSEQLFLLEPGDIRADVITMTGRVADHAYLGNATQLIVDLDGGGKAALQVAGATPATTAPLGAAVKIGLKRTDALVVPDAA